MSCDNRYKRTGTSSARGKGNAGRVYCQEAMDFIIRHLVPARPLMDIHKDADSIHPILSFTRLLLSFTRLGRYSAGLSLTPPARRDIVAG